MLWKYSKGQLEKNFESEYFSKISNFGTTKLKILNFGIFNLILDRGFDRAYWLVIQKEQSLTFPSLSGRTIYEWKTDYDIGVDQVKLQFPSWNSAIICNGRMHDHLVPIKNFECMINWSLSLFWMRDHLVFSMMENAVSPGSPS